MGLADKYGASLGSLTLAPQGMAGSGASNGAIASTSASKWNVENPYLWLLGLGVVTLGLVAASTSLRVGPVRASLSAGKS